MWYFVLGKGYEKRNVHRLLDKKLRETTKGQKMKIRKHLIFGWAECDNWKGRE